MTMELEALCPREEETMAAARAGVWAAELREHARLCPDCAAIAGVQAALAEQAAALAAGPVPGSAEALLWRAHLRARVAAAERAARPVAWFDRIALGVAAALGVLFLLWRGESLFGWLGQSVGGRVAATPTLAVLLIVLLGFTGSVLWMFSSWAEE